MSRHQRVQFGPPGAPDDRLIEAILAGEKTASIELTLLYRTRRGDFHDGGYRVGDFVDGYDSESKRRAVIRITEVYSTSMATLPDKLWREAGFASPEELRDAHADYWPDYEIQDRTPLTAFHFDLARPEFLQLRTTTKNDLSVFYEHQLDRKAVHMAAFTTKNPSDRRAFLSRWSRILVLDGMTRRTVTVEGKVAGHIMSFEHDDIPELTYWFGQEFWGRGIATRALEEFLARHFTTRPVYARVATDNVGSIRVLERCGFQVIDEVRGFANARGTEIDELVLKLSR